MADFIIIDGDQAIFNPAFGLATVVVKPGDLKLVVNLHYKAKKYVLMGMRKVYLFLGVCIQLLFTLFQEWGH